MKREEKIKDRGCKGNKKIAPTSVTANTLLGSIFHKVYCMVNPSLSECFVRLNLGGQEPAPLS